MAVEDVIIALPAHAHNLTAQLARECESRGINVRIVPDLFPLIQSDTQVYDLDGIPLVNVRLYPTEYLRYAILKRVFDVLCVARGLGFILPALCAHRLIRQTIFPWPRVFRAGTRGLERENSSRC